MIEKKLKTGKSNIWKRLVTVLVLILLLFLAQRIVMPKYAEGIVEGAMIQEFYKEEKNFDVIFIGDCEVYENFSPLTLWDTYGINSYIRGSAEQYIFQSYYLLEDTLRYEKPKAVVFNIQSLQYNTSISEAYNRMTIDGMRWSSAKVGSILASMTEGEHFIEYVFPLLRYHSRWKELNASDFKYLFSSPKITYNGYYMRVDVRPAKDIPAARPLGDYSFGENAWKYLDKIRECCEKNDIQLLLIKAPSLYPHWHKEWDAQVVDYASRYGLTYLNFLDHIDEIGLDYDTDTYDGGLHMNLSGAEKCAVYIGRFLSEQFHVPDRRSDPHLCEIWENKKAEYDAEIQRQKRKLTLSGGE